MDIVKSDEHGSALRLGKMVGGRGGEYAPVKEGQSLGSVSIRRIVSSQLTDRSSEGCIQQPGSAP